MAVQGDILYRNATQWVRLPAGTAGRALVTGGAGANPSWYDGLSGTIEFYAAATSGGTVDVLNTVVITEGLITSWVQGAPAGTGTPIGLLLALSF